LKFWYILIWNRILKILVFSLILIWAIIIMMIAL
jgi:hypothetical protein